MSEVSIDQIADEMYALVKSVQGKKNLKPMDLVKAMIEKFGDDVTKKDCKAAIRSLMETERCTYSYVGGSYVTLPPE